jgi:predicted dehydrogenase
MDTIRFGITGSGFMGRTHAEAIKLAPGASLTAIWGGMRASRLASDYGVDCEPSLNDLVRRADIDAIVVTTPHYLHADEAMATIEAGKHVLVEKPLATSVEDCDRLIEAAARAGVALGVGYQQRFRGNNVRARDLIRNNAAGALQTVQVSMPIYMGGMKDGSFGGAWDWWANAASIGHVLNSAPHAIDLLRWFTGDEVSRVSAFSRTFGPDRDVEDTTLAIFELSNGTLCSLFSSRALPAPIFPGEDFRFRIAGEKVLIDLDPYDELRIADQDGWHLVSKQPPVGHLEADSAFAGVRMQAYRDQISAFLDAIHGKPATGGSGADGRAGVEACLAMLASSREQRFVRLTHPRSQSLGSV